jgi:hypothetical protein
VRDSFGLGPLVSWLSGAGPAKGQEAISLAQELAHPYSLVYALNFAGRLHQVLREGQAAQERAEAALALCSEREFGLYLAVGTSLRGWALADQGQSRERELS